MLDNRKTSTHAPIRFTCVLKLQSIGYGHIHKHPMNHAMSVFPSCINFSRTSFLTVYPDFDFFYFNRKK